MRDWLSRLLLGMTSAEIDRLEQELTIERKLRLRLESDLAKAQTEWANANGARNRLQVERTELRTKLARCKCNVN